MSRSIQAWLMVSAAWAAGCAHAPAVPPPADPVTWPASPARARLRLVRQIPAPAAPEDRGSGWSRFWRAVVGLGPPDADSRRMERPFGVAIRGDRVVVADPDGQAVLTIAPDGSTGRIECAGLAWNAPMAVAAEPSGSLFVADAGIAQVVRIDPDGRCAVLGQGQFERPTGVAYARDQILVADPPRHMVTALGTDGAVRWRVGGRGEGEGTFDFPTAVATAPDGTLLVVDALNFRVVRLSSSGAWLATFGAPGEEDGLLARPKGVATDGDRIYVSDAQRDLILVFRVDGTFDAALGEGGGGPGRFVHPAGLAVEGGRLLVADSLNRRVQVFEILGGQP